jgi:hypothetical protein
MRAMESNNEIVERSPSRLLGSNRAYVEALLDRLDAAARRTDPAKGSDSERGKDHEAFGALLVAGELVRAVAGWAIEHVYGLSLEEEKLLPRQPSPTNSDPAYKSYRAFTDSHRHERKGRELLEPPEKLTASQKQMIFRNLLFSGAHGFPGWLRCESYEAIDALRYGELTTLLRPVKRKRRKRRFRELHAQLKAISIVRFRTRIFGSKDKALKEVADCFAVDIETLRSWEKRLPKEIGEIEFKREVAFAENRAAYVAHAQSLSARGKSIDPNASIEYESLKRISDNNLDMYGDRALQSAAENHRRLCRDKT